MVEVLIEYCREKLDIENAFLGDEYFYHSVPLCVIDSVFSIGAQYTSTRNTVKRFCSFSNFPLVRDTNVTQLPVSEFLGFFDVYGIEGMTNDVFKNRQRTSPKNGILKSEACFRFAQVLADMGVETFEQIPTIISNMIFEKRIKKIPGQQSGISTTYFYMLAGSDDFIKPDRMIARFIFEATGENLNIESSQRVIRDAVEVLKLDNPVLTPRLLDHQIWLFQRDSKVKNKIGSCRVEKGV